ncbi:MAG: hypothetical protein HC876_18725 [Chloroflexaceae bacterium]|nr:hypothetical protein [Chloroflexaceae bacterium]
MWVGTYQAARDSSSSVPLAHVTVVGTTAYVTINVFAWLDIIDIRDPTQPTLIGRYIDEPEASFGSVAVQNDLLYASITGNGFQIIDVSTPSAPTLLGSYGGRDGVDLAVQGDIVYLGSVTRTPIGVEGAVSLVDVQDSTQPTFLSNANVIAARIKVQNGFAYVAPGQVGQGRSGMTIVNVQDPTNPTPIISYEQDVLAIFPVNDLVYLHQEPRSVAIPCMSSAYKVCLTRPPTRPRPPLAASTKPASVSTVASATTGSRTAVCLSSASPSVRSGPSPSKGSPSRRSGSSATAWSCTRKTRRPMMCCWAA